MNNIWECISTVNNLVWLIWYSNQLDLGRFISNLKLMLVMMSEVLTPWECHWVLLVMRQHWFRQWLRAVRSVSSDMASLCHSICMMTLSNGNILYCRRCYCICVCWSFQSDIPLFTLTWPVKDSPNQGWESTHRLHLYPLGGVFYSP